MNKIKLFRGKANCGKTTALLLNALMASEAKKKVAFVTTELNEDLLIGRLIKICKITEIRIPEDKDFNFTEYKEFGDIERLIVNGYKEIYIDNFYMLRLKESNIQELYVLANEYNCNIYAAYTAANLPHSISSNFNTIDEIVENKNFNDINEFFISHAYVTKEENLVRTSFETGEVLLNLNYIFN